MGGSSSGIPESDLVPDGGNSGDNGESDGNSGFFDSVIGWFTSIGESIKALPQTIWSYIKGGFDNIAIALNDVWNSIQELSDKITNGIKAIFIPDPEEIKGKFEGLTNALQEQFNFDTSFFEGLFGVEKPIEDVEGDYYISGVGSFNLKFFDKKYFIDGVEFFRPYIQGVIILFLAFYNIKNILALIRQDAGVATGKVVDFNLGLDKESRSERIKAAEERRKK